MKNLFFLLILCTQVASAQSGINWSPAMPVAASSFSNEHPRVAVDGSGNPLIVWGRTNAQRAYFSRWIGTGFSTPSIVSSTIPVFTASWAGPDLAAFGDTVYVAMKQTPEDTNHIYLVHSYDGGVNFSSPVRVDYIGDFVSRFPTVTVDSVGHPVVAFMKFDPGFQNARYVVTRSNDFGLSFQPDVDASGFSGGAVCDCCPATIVSAGNRIVTAYRDNLNNLRNSWSGLSTDGGKTFPEGIQIDDTDWMVSACPSSGPDGVIVGDSLYAVFMSAANGNTRCYWSKASLITREASSAMLLTNEFPGLTQQNFPRITSNGAAAAIVWRQTVSNMGQLVLRFTNEITDGFPSDYDTLALGTITNADLAMTNGKLYVVWEDGNSGQVYFRQGTYATTGVAAIEQPTKAMSIFPNPLSGDLLSVFLKNQPNGHAQYRIFNLKGQVVLEDHTTLVDGRLTIDAASLLPGLYLLKVSCGGYVFVGKVVR